VQFAERARFNAAARCGRLDAQIRMPLLRTGGTCGGVKMPQMLDVIIVDDEPTARRTLRECCVREPDLRIIGEYGDSRSALEAIRAQPPHLLFLDIQIDSLNGVGIARSLDPQKLPLIVFVRRTTNTLDAFE